MGGAIGTGLFLGSAQVIQSAGPSIILGYAIGGLIAFLIMRQLGEMIVHEPVAGSFSHFAYKYWGKFPGFPLRNILTIGGLLFQLGHRYCFSLS